jgi:hypothetical protein
MALQRHGGLQRHGRWIVLGSLALLACSDHDSHPKDFFEQHSDEIVDIEHTAVKRQSIGNCWVYASVGWAESLRLTHAGETLNLSESWIGYWHWYEQIVGSANPQPPIASLSKGELATGGWWGTAAEIMRRYGVMDEGAFISEEAEQALSQRQSQALAAINASLATGTLASAANRADRALVRQVLDDAWGLSPAVRQLMDGVFGADVAHTLYEQRPIPEGSGLRYASSISVGSDASDPKQPITLADAIGKPASWYDITNRVGPYAWKDTSYPYFATARREQIRQMQIALHKRLPVIMSWFVDFNAMGGDGTFRQPPAEPGRQGGHMTALEDYEIDNVPGYGTLHAGTLVTDPAALQAALAEQAALKFVRVKNSWGTALAPPQGLAQFAGYHDVYADYLNATLTYCTGSGSDPCATTSSTRGLWTFVLPPSNFSSDKPVAAVCATHDACTKGAALDPSCSPCVEKICADDAYCCTNEWDAICVKQVQTVCGDASCQADGGDTGAPACAHDKCVTGGKLSADCADPCVAKICAADPYCCNTAWDSYCVNAVEPICGATCP